MPYAARRYPKPCSFILTKTVYSRAPNQYLFLFLFLSSVSLPRRLPLLAHPRAGLHPTLQPPGTRRIPHFPTTLIALELDRAPPPLVVDLRTRVRARGRRVGALLAMLQLHWRRHEGYVRRGRAGLGVSWLLLWQAAWGS